MKNFFLIVILIALAITMVKLVAKLVRSAVLKRVKRGFDTGLHLGYTEAMQDMEDAPDMDPDVLFEQFVKKHGLEELVNDPD